MDNALVFTAPDGGPLHAGNFRRRVWRPATRATGIELRFHDLRHTAGTLAATTPGATLRDVQARLGHASAITARGGVGERISPVRCGEFSQTVLSLWAVLAG
jgi:integrase